MPEDSGGDLERLLADRGEQLLRTAVLLTGSRSDGEDLLQAGLERLLRRGRIDGSTEGYLRRTLYNLAADGWRRQGAWRRRFPVLGTSQSAAEPDLTVVVDLREALIGILRQLPPQQRAVIVLRYWEQLSYAETAVALGCSEGTAKSAGSRGLQRMRDLAGPWLATKIEPGKAR